MNELIKHPKVNIRKLTDQQWPKLDLEILYSIEFLRLPRGRADMLAMNETCNRVYGEKVAFFNGLDTLMNIIVYDGEDKMYSAELNEADWFRGAEHRSRSDDHLIFYNLYLTTEEQYTMFCLVFAEYLI